MDATVVAEIWTVVAEIWTNTGGDTKAKEAAGAATKAKEAAEAATETMVADKGNRVTPTLAWGEIGGILIGSMRGHLTKN